MDIKTRYSIGQRVSVDDRPLERYQGVVVGIRVLERDGLFYDVRPDGNWTPKATREEELEAIEPAQIEALDAARAYNELVAECHRQIHAASDALAPLIDPIIYTGTTEEVEKLLDIFTEGSYYQFEVRRQLRFRNSKKD